MSQALGAAGAKALGQVHARGIPGGADREAGGQCGVVVAGDEDRETTRDRSH